MESVPALPSLTSLPAEVIGVTDALRSGLERILGNALASLFLYGAIAFPRPDAWAIDFDFHVLLDRALVESERDAITALYADLAAASELGADLDGYFVLLSDAREAAPPRHQLDPRVRDDAWALHRAHVHAGRYFAVTGLDPRAVVPVPTWPELAGALHAELRFVESHPHATAFGILNGARILYSFETHDVVVSKFKAGHWALDALPAKWRDAVRAAMRCYEQQATDADRRLLQERREPFVAYVKRVVPAATP